MKDWSRVIGLMLPTGKTHDIARECQISGLWHFVDVGAKSSQTPITSNRVSKVITSIINELTDKAKSDFQTKLNAGDLAGATPYMALATDSINSLKDDKGDVIKNKLEVEVDTLKALYPTEWETMKQQGVAIYIQEGKIIGNNKEEAYNALVAKGFDVNTLIKEA